MSKHIILLIKAKSMANGIKGLVCSIYQCINYTTSPTKGQLVQGLTSLFLFFFSLLIFLMQKKIDVE